MSRCFHALVLGLAALPITTPAAPFGLLDARTLAMAGAGVAAGGRYEATINPALVALVDERREVYFDVPSLGAETTYSGTLADGLDAFQTAAARFEAAPNEQHRAAVIAALDSLGARADRAGLYVGGSVGLPSLPVGLAVYTHGRYLQRIEARLGADRNLADPARPRYDAVVAMRGAAFVESGAVVARVARAGAGGSNRLAMGVSPKIVVAHTYAYAADARTVDLDAPPKTHTQTSHTNLDVGLVQEFGYVWKAGLVARDLRPKTFAWGDGSGESLRLRPQVIAGLTWRSPHWLLAVDADITSRPVLGSERAGHRLAGGAERSLGAYWRLRGGADLTYDGRYTPGLALGLGLRMGGLEADVGARGDGRTLAVAAQVGLRF